MSRRAVFFLALVFGVAPGARADTIQLRDRAAVVGNILAEKRDQVIVDLGYTVLSIPRNQVVKILPGESVIKGGKTGAAAAKPVEMKPGFYTAMDKPSPERTVRDLVNQLGEAVVQVRTPGGLGSGFIINEDGFLMTNFHVIEGETQISVEVYHQKDGQLTPRVTSRSGSSPSTNFKTSRC